jgi:putative transposase
MKTSKFSDSQKMQAMQRVEAGLPIRALCLELGITSATFHNWRNKADGGLNAQIVRVKELEKKIKELEKENQRLLALHEEEKRIAHLAIAHLEKKVLRPFRREMAIQAVKEGKATIKIACQVFSISESTYRYELKEKTKPEVQEITDLLLKLTNENPHWGFTLCYRHLREVEGRMWNHKRIYRIYRHLELNLRPRLSKRQVK